MKKKILYAFIGILLLFIITNPSVKQFDEFIKSEPFYKKNVFQESRVRTARSANFFVFSFFTIDYKAQRGHYVGFLGNFFNREVQ